MMVATYPVCGIPIAASDVDAAAGLIVDAASARRTLAVHLCNAYTLSLVRRDPVLATALRESDLNLPDGVPVAWLGRRRGVAGPVRGPALLPRVADIGRAAEISHYFYGGARGVAEAVAIKVRERFPGVTVAGAETPPFGEISADETQALIARVRASGAGVLWIGLGTPRQDYLVARLARALDIPIVPVGAAFDFVAGTVREAPSYLHGSGVEWVHRFVQEPRRLWRRYTIGNLRFVASVFRSCMKDGRSRC
jgi:N-acetylglucosaminyldiphosphoundecaprenol N-acetyl-beta-D-mannosaminyltransferase